MGIDIIKVQLRTSSKTIEDNYKIFKGTRSEIAD
jgi:hypothetical protein